MSLSLLACDTQTRRGAIDRQVVTASNTTTPAMQLGIHFPRLVTRVLWPLVVGILVSLEKYLVGFAAQALRFGFMAPGSV